MASEDKTEEPTAHKRQEAEKKGNIAKSKDLSSAVELFGAVSVLKYVGPYFAHLAVNFTETVFINDLPNIVAPYKKEIIPYALEWAMWLAILTLPFLVGMVIFAFLSNVYMVGLGVHTQALKIDFNKLNPVSGFKRIFSVKSVVMLVMNLAKLSVIMAVAWSTISYEFTNVMVMVDMETAGTFLYSTDKVLSLAQKLALILLVLGFADYQYQKHNTTKGLKMSRHEIKEEHKQMEGDPKVKGERRKRQMQMAMQRMMNEVPQAEVVVRNPTHFAVAISYKPGMPAPQVVAKGQDKLAERIIEVAREAKVPLVENPPLARELYKKVEVGQDIPEELFATVAAILASVMSEEKKRKMMRDFSRGVA